MCVYIYMCVCIYDLHKCIYTYIYISYHIIYVVALTCVCVYISLQGCKHACL